MKRIFYYLTLLIFLSGFGKSIAQNPTYTLIATNTHFNSTRTQIEWDIYLLHTNPPTPFVYAGGQYLFDFDSGLIVDGGTLTYSLVGTDIQNIFPPSFTSVYLGGGEHQLRLIIHAVSGGYVITNNGSSNGGLGTLLARVRLSTTTEFNTFYEPEIKWRNSHTHPYPYTLINAFVGGTGTDITTPDYHFSYVGFGGITGQFGIAILPYAPVYGSAGVPFPVRFNWSSTFNPLYKLDVATDYQFNNLVFSNSSITDTFYTVHGLSAMTKYYWRIASYINGLSCFCTNSAISTFTTGPGITVSLKVIPEGLYDSLTNLLNRKDSITVYLRGANSPYPLVDSVKSLIDSVSCTGLFKFQTAPPGTYYIVVKNLNCIETWSSSAYPLTSGSFNYDFSTAKTQAFGDNLLQVDASPVRFAIYSGDATQDEFVNLMDIIQVSNDGINFVTGYVSSDMNGDSFVNLADLLITYNNSAGFVSIRRP